VTRQQKQEPFKFTLAIKSSMHESQICVTSQAQWTNVPNMERFKKWG